MTPSFSPNNPHL